MHRTIKFRAWTGKTMMYQEKQYLGSFLRRVVTRIMLEHGSDTPKEHESYLPQGTAIDDYLLQWTGFTDRKKQDVYDGDFLGNEWGKYRVFWDRGGFVVQSEDGFRHNIGDMDIQALEVIGNERENPDLFKEA